MIILVSGSRWWNDYKLIHSTIRRYHELAREQGEILEVRHGDNNSGADRLAKCIVYRMHSEGIFTVLEDPMPAEWQHEGCDHPKGTRRDGQWYCKLAGGIRNQAMIDKGGIYRVEAYPLPGGTGTADCVRRAVDAGLVVTNHGFPTVTMEEMLKPYKGMLR